MRFSIVNMFFENNSRKQICDMFHSYSATCSAPEKTLQRMKKNTKSNAPEHPNFPVPARNSTKTSRVHENSNKKRLPLQKKNPKPQNILPPTQSGLNHVLRVDVRTCQLDKGCKSRSHSAPRRPNLSRVAAAREEGRQRPKTAQSQHVVLLNEQA